MRVYTVSYTLQRTAWSIVKLNACRPTIKLIYASREPADTKCTRLLRERPALEEDAGSGSRSSRVREPRGTRARLDSHGHRALIYDRAFESFVSQFENRPAERRSSDELCVFSRRA